MIKRLLWEITEFFSDYRLVFLAGTLGGLFGSAVTMAIIAL